MMTVCVRYKNPFARTETEDVGAFLTELLRNNPNRRFYLLVAPNRMFAFGYTLKDERSERWRVKEFRYIRDDKFRPSWLYFSPFNFIGGEYSAILYGGVMGRVEREKGGALHFYLVEPEISLSLSEREAGATKEEVREIFAVWCKDGYATIRPLLSDAEPKEVHIFNTPSTELLRNLNSYVAGVMKKQRV
jgi:hypothetical protein